MQNNRKSVDLVVCSVDVTKGKGVPKWVGVLTESNETAQPVGNGSKDMWCKRRRMRAGARCGYPLLVAHEKARISGEKKK